MCGRVVFGDSWGVPWNTVRVLGRTWFFFFFFSCIYFLLFEHVRNGQMAQFFYDISVISLYFWYKYDIKSNGYAVAFLLLSSVYLPFLFYFSFPKVITFLCCKISLSEPNSYIASEYIFNIFLLRFELFSRLRPEHKIVLKNKIELVFTGKRNYLNNSILFWI